jgi:hypothetical protein
MFTIICKMLFNSGIVQKSQKQTNISNSASQMPLLVSSPPFIKSASPIAWLHHQISGKKSVTAVLLTFCVLLFLQMDGLQKCSFVRYNSVLYLLPRLLQHQANDKNALNIMKVMKRNNTVVQKY